VVVVERADATEARRVREGLLLILRPVVHARHVVPRIVQIQLVRLRAVAQSAVVGLSSTVAWLRAGHVRRVAMLGLLLLRHAPHEGHATPASGVSLVAALIVGSTRWALHVI